MTINNHRLSTSISKLVRQNSDLLIIVAEMTEKGGDDFNSRCLPQYIFVEKNSGEWQAVIFEKLAELEGGGKLQTENNY